MYCIVKLNIKIAGIEYFKSQEISLTEKTYDDSADAPKIRAH